MESGAADLNSFISFYYYKTFDERDVMRKAANANADWATYAVRKLLSFIALQSGSTAK